MDITASTIYWITRLDSALKLMFVLALLSGMFSICCSIVALIVRDIDPKDTIAGSLVKIVQYSTTALVLACLALVFTPSTQEAAAMYVVPAIVNNEKMRDAGNKLYDLAIEWLDELKPAKKEITKSEKEN